MIDHGLEEGVDADFIYGLHKIGKGANAPKAVPADQFFELHEALNEKIPNSPLRVGEKMKMDDYGVLGLSWKTCSKARDIFDRSVRYFNLLTNTYVFKVEDEDELSKIYLFREAYRKGVALSNVATFSSTVTVIQAITEKEIFPVEVSFKHDAPPDVAAYAERFQCPVHFNQETNFIAFKKSDLDTRTAKADISINRFLEERVEEEAKGLEVSSNKLVEDIRKLIVDALPSGIPAVDHIAEHLGMSNRTLTRRLSGHGYTFRELVSSTQRKIATDQLKNTDCTIGEIAFQTGFSEQSAFNRAFKRWTGQSPIAFRKESR